VNRERAPIRVGIDIGGTFTDLQIHDPRQRIIRSYKVATTPEDPSIGLIRGLTEASQRYQFALQDIGYILHGTTIATNAVLERKFPRGALVTTAGFEDVLEIGRHSRREIYSVWPQPASPLIERKLRFGVVERMTARGEPEIPLTEAELSDLVEKLRSADVATVAVCLLNAYLNPDHENRVAERLARDLPSIAVSLSSEVSPEIREYERSNTTVLNALLIPVVRRYLERLEGRLREAGIGGRLLIVQSNGGVCSPETAAREPVRLLLSGPSGGALGALALSREFGAASLVGVDMGGTSFDVSVVHNDRIEVITQGEIDRLPVRVPMIEIRTIGAGGGSIARVDAAKRVTVGPESAGANPGPVCYGRGGVEPTVTDANLLLGRLDAEYFLGGAMLLDLAGAQRAIREKFAQPLDLPLEPAANGIIAITNTSLAAAIRLSLFEKGLDPRDFTILSFGGAGSIHACAVADELGIKRIIFPANASTFSAWGILHSDIAHDFARSRVMPFDEMAQSPLQEIVTSLREQGESQLTEDAIPENDREYRLAVDLRYKGQAFELTIPWSGDRVDAAAIKATRDAFHATHKQRFSYSNPHDIVELVTVRLTAVGRLARESTDEEDVPVSETALRHRRVWLGDAWHELPVWKRDALRPGTRIDGPAIVEEDYTTVLIGPGWEATCGPHRHLIAVKNGGAR